ncbi:regulatory protein GemA [Thalassovita sp.]|uniref:gp16 family protein n=1 Tax=Thalassovita sp. TaxID=1979401 RepID=UPI002B26CA33|nr:regulatory protein GemA [Thalassovita sp.]
MSDALRKMIFVGCRELGIDTETRKEMQARLTGKSSLVDMTEAELKLVVDNLKQRGFKAQSGRKRKAAPRADLRLIHVLWAKLGEAGALNDPSRAGLNAFIRKQFGNNWQSVPADVDMLRDWHQIDDVVQALKAWARRVGADFDFKRVR